MLDGPLKVVFLDVSICKCIHVHRNMVSELLVFKISHLLSHAAKISQDDFYVFGLNYH